MSIKTTEVGSGDEEAGADQDQNDSAGARAKHLLQSRIKGEAV